MMKCLFSYINKRKGWRPEKIWNDEDTGRYELCYLNPDSTRHQTVVVDSGNGGWLCTKPMVVCQLIIPFSR